MSIVMKHASFVEITLLKRIFATSISAGVVDPVSPYNELCSIGFSFFWSYRAHEFSICDVFHPIQWNFVLEYKLDGVGGIFYSAAGAVS